MKLFVTIFAAVLVAGLVLLGAHRYIVSHDKRISEWEKRAERAATELDRSSAANSPADLERVRLQIDYANALLNIRPTGANGESILRSSVKRAEESIRDASEKARTKEERRRKLAIDAEKKFAEAKSIETEIAEMQHRFSSATTDEERASLAAQLILKKPRVGELRREGEAILDEAAALSR